MLITASLADAEPLLTDERVGRIEGTIRREFPGLPDMAAFATCIVQPPPTEDQWGLVYPSPPEAWFVISGPWPKEPEKSLGMWYQDIGRTPLDKWRAYEAESKHYVDGREDAALRWFRIAARNFLAAWDTMTNLSGDKKPPTMAELVQQAVEDG